MGGISHSNGEFLLLMGVNAVNLLFITGLYIYICVYIYSQVDTSMKYSNLYTFYVVFISIFIFIKHLRLFTFILLLCTFTLFLVGRKSRFILSRDRKERLITK